MAAGIKTADFVRLTREHARDSTTWANFFGNELTAEHRRELSPVLRDNFGKAARARGGTISKDEFVQTLTRYTRTMARTADRNGDGTLSAAEAKRLPKDLQDNVADAVRVANGVDWKNASDTRVARAGREALVNYLEQVLFNPKNREGSHFRREVLSSRTAPERERVKKEMLAEARSWSASKPGWERGDWDSRTLVVDGKLWDLSTNVFFERGSRPRVLVEID